MGENYLQWLYGANNSMLSVNHVSPTLVLVPTISPKFRTPITQNIAPSYSVQPLTHKGVTDLNPNPNGENAVGEKSGTPWGMIASVAAANVGGFFDGLNPGIYAKDLLLEAGTSNSSIRGVGYQVLNNIDADRIRSDYDRNNFKKIWSGNIGGFIGGLFGKSKLNKEIKAALEQATRTTNFNRDMAATTGMQTDFRSKYGNQEDLMLYAAHGKDRFNHVVTTLKGGTPGQNAWVSKGEGIYDTETGNAKYVPFGENDTAPANLKPQDVVFGDLINPYTGRMFKKDAEQYIIAKENLDKKRPKTTDKATIETYEKVSAPLADALNAKLQDLAQTQHEVMLYNNYTNLIKAKHGKDSLPKMKLGGWVPNAIAGGLGVGASIAQYFDAKNQDIYRPHTYVENPYERRALDDLYGLRINPYNMMQLLRNIAGRANYAVDTSGGLSAGLKMLQKTAIAANTQNNTANALQSIAEKNIGLRSAADTAALQAGARNASNRMNALRWDSDMYAKAHAARLGGMQTAQANFLAQIQQYLANEYKRKMGNAMIDLYSNDLRSGR